MLRMDHVQRPELNRGTVDFIVSEAYWAQHPPPKINLSYASVEPPPTGTKKPVPLDYLFAFDVSHDAIETGFLKTACDLLRTVLYGGTSVDGQQIEPCFPAASRIAIMTYDLTLHFYDLNVRIYFFFFQNNRLLIHAWFS